MHQIQLTHQQLKHGDISLSQTCDLFFVPYYTTYSLFTSTTKRVIFGFTRYGEMTLHNMSYLHTHISRQQHIYIINTRKQNENIKTKNNKSQERKFPLPLIQQRVLDLLSPPNNLAPKLLAEKIMFFSQTSHYYYRIFCLFLLIPKASVLT